MAISSLTSKSSFHARSASVPSSSHPSDTKIDEQLLRLRYSESASTSSSINNKVHAIHDLYACFEEILLLPLNQQALIKDRSTKWVDNLLERSLKLLDICSSTRDALSETRESVQEVQSVMRRRCGRELSVNEVAQYIKSRKSTKKSIQKISKELKNILNDLEKDQGCVAVGNATKEVQEATVSLFQSLLSYLSVSKSQSKKRRWSILFKNESLVCESQAVCDGDFEEVDATIQAQISAKKKINTEDLSRQILQLESTFQDLDKGMECLFRVLVKSRARFLTSSISRLAGYTFTVNFLAQQSQEN